MSDATLPDTIAKRLGEIADELDAIETRQLALYAERVSLWVTCWYEDVTHAQMGAWARVTEGAVTQILGKLGYTRKRKQELRRAQMKESK